MPCPNCGADSPPGARFCWSCGHSLLVRLDERRVITVVFGDIVGFTALSEKLDPEGLKNVIDRCFARLAADIVSFGGQVDKVIGDAIVALFGATVAHEDDAERAVRAAMKMQDTIRSLDAELGRAVRMRIGVNTGEALVGAISADRDVTAMGDVVNTASRLQTAAAPGTVLVGRATHDATISVIRYERLDPIDAKGKESPVEAFVAIEPFGLPGERRSNRPDAPLVGRDDELALLRRSIATSFTRRRSLLTLVLGDAGVGKTRIVQEVMALLERENGPLILTGRCVPYGEANIWWPIADAVRGSMGLDVSAPLEVAEDVVRKAVAAAYRAEPDSAHVDRAATGLLHLLDYDTPLRSLDPTGAHTESARAVRTYLQALTNQQPVVLWLADLHWADEFVLRMVNGLVQRLARLPFVLVATARHVLNERWSPEPGRFNSVTLNLDALDVVAAGELLRHLVGTEVPAEVADDLIRRSGGNPFFIEELAALVRDGRLGAGDTIHLPGSVRGVVSSRLDGLLTEERELLEDAAVLGRRGSVDALQRMASSMRSRDDVSMHLLSLADKDLLLLDRTERREWAFRSDVVRDVVYGRLTKAERARRHAAIAVYLEANDEVASVDSIAFHFRRAAELVRELGKVDGVDPATATRAVEWLQRAAVGADATPEIGVRLYTQALGLVDPEDGDRRADLLLARARAEIDTRQIAAARRDVDDAQRATQTEHGRVDARSALLLGEIEQRSGDFDLAIEHLHVASARYQALGLDAGVGEALRAEGMTNLLAGRMLDAERCTHQALELFQKNGNRLGEAWARQNLAWIAFASGHLRQAEERIEVAAALFGELSDTTGQAWTRGLLAFVRMHEGRLEEADATAALAMRDARERGDRWGDAMMLIVRSSVLLWSGHVEAAVKRSEEAVSLMRAIDDTAGIQQAVAVQGRALVQAGRTSEGFAALRLGLDLGTGTTVGVNQLVSTAAGAAAVALGDPEEARRWLTGTDLSRLDPSIVGHSDRIVALGLAALQLGEIDDALSLLRRAVADDDEGAVSGYAAAMLSLALVAHGDADAARAMAHAARTTSRSTYADKLMAGLALACLEARDGDQLMARDALDEATEIARGTDDHLAPMLVTFAAAAASSRLAAREASPGFSAPADVLTQRARELAAAIGTDGRGWERAFALACGAS
jgi:class 3 adenylate cyclase/tetratricopeptide (TPR) repeat protein